MHACMYMGFLPFLNSFLLRFNLSVGQTLAHVLIIDLQTDQLQLTR